MILHKKCKIIYLCNNKPFKLFLMDSLKKRNFFTFQVQKRHSWLWDDIETIPINISNKNCVITRKLPFFAWFWQNTSASFPIILSFRVITEKLTRCKRGGFACKQPHISLILWIKECFCTIRNGLRARFVPASTHPGLSMVSRLIKTARMTWRYTIPRITMIQTFFY